MKNKEIILAGAILLLVLAIFGIKKFGIDINMPFNIGKFASKEEGLTEKAWNTFDQYMNFAKENDIEGVRSLSYQLGPVCSDPARVEECKGLLNGVYELGQEIKKEKFTNIISDKKQVILYGEYERYEDADIIGHLRSIIYFTRDENGDLKLLSFNPTDGAFFLKKNITDDINVDDELRKMLKDRDTDTLPDQAESCIDENKLNACTNTDPKKRDTDGNEWWDSIEMHFK
jgi:hypothetical protein